MGFTKKEMDLVLLACCLGGFVTPLLSTMMNLSLVNIGSEFNVGSHDLGYVNTAFLLTSVIAMVPAARLGDIIGRKRMYLLGMVIMGVACLLAPLSPNFWALILCRAVIGVGAAASTCMSVALIADVFPKEVRGGALGLQTMCVYIGLAAGPVIGGIVNDIAGWHGLFLLVVPLAVASIVCMSMFRHEITPACGSTMDYTGTVLYGIAILASMVGVLNLPELWAVVLLVIGVVFLIIFGLQQSRTENFLLNVHLFRSRVFTGSCVASFMCYAASYSLNFFLPLYLQNIGMMTSTEAGMMLLTQPFIQAIFTPMFGRLSDKMSDKRILPTVGMAIAAIGEISVVFYSTTLSTPIVMTTMVLVGFGFAMFSAPNTSILMSSVPPAETGEASAMTSVTRQTGMMVSMGIAMLCISVIMGSADNISPETYDDFLVVLRTAFVIAFMMCCIGAVFSVLRGNDDN